MKNIAIVDDEDAAAEVLNGYIGRYSQESGKTFNVVRFRSAEEFLENYVSIYAVVFMDIQMSEMNGMKAAETLRRKDKSVSIIFVTNLMQYALSGYEVDAVGFIVKPVQYFDFLLKFEKALDTYVMNEGRSITIASSNGLCRVSTDKLMYVEIIKHRLYYHLVDGTLEMTGVLSSVEAELSKYGFLRCNHCYLVNPRFIVKVVGQDVYVGNTVLQISRPKKATFLKELLRWFSLAEKKDDV